MQMIKEKLGFAARRFLVSLLFLIGISIVLHGIELAVVVSSNQAELTPLLLLQAIMNDAVFAANIGFYTFLVYAGIYLVSDFTARMLMALTLLVIIANQIGLMQYYLVSHMLLGADFWSYSWSDIKLTVKASADVKWWQILAFPLIIGLAMRLHYTLQQHTFTLYPSLSILATLTVLGVFSPMIDLETVGQKNLAANKAHYFLIKSKEYYAQRHNDDGVKGLITGANTLYPFQTKQNRKDELGQYLRKSAKPPNIVMVLVEGLGKTFVGPEADYAGCMPFMDSLSQKSLFWTNFISTTGRTFGVLPAVLGSLPFGPSGFMEMGNDAPYHTSMVKLLKQNGYQTGFYYGGDATFDGQQLFLQKQGIDFVLDEKNYPESFEKIPANSGGFSWGYPDKELFRRSFEVLADKAPYFSIYLTVTTHEPFVFKGSEKYDKRIQNFLLQYDNNSKIAENQNAFKTLMYADDALRYLIETYKTRPEYENTIFIITGDHRMIPIKHKNELDRYNVPLLIYSPLLKTNKIFKSMCSHADLPSTLTAYLQKQYKLTFPDSVHWLGTGLTYKTSFSSDKQIAIMRNKGDISEMVYGEDFITDGALLTIGDNLTLKRNDDKELLEKLMGQLNQFKQLNNYVCKYNKLYNVKNTFIASNTGGIEDQDTANIEEEVEAVADKSRTMPLERASQAQAKSSSNKEESKQTVSITKETPQEIPRPAKNRAPNKGEAAFIMGKIHAELGNYKQAKQLLAQAIANGYKKAESYRLLIELELSFNKQPEALKWYNEAITEYNKESFADLYKKISAE
jgi:lipoteichoic acid synthase